MNQRRSSPRAPASFAAWRPGAGRRPGLPWVVRRLRRRGFYAVVRGLVALIRVLPRPVAVGFLRTLAAVAHRTLDRERRVAEAQLRRALPALSPVETERLARASYEALSRNLADMLRQDVEVSVDEAAQERIDRARERGPVLVLMGHWGAWELIGPVLVERMPPFAALTADPHNEWVDRWLRRERSARGITVFDRDRELRPALRWLREGGTLAVLGDHRTRGTQVLAPWFGSDVPTPAGPSRLARAAGATILPVGIRRQGSGHRLEVGSSFVSVGDAHQDARRCNQALEELILLRPEEWTWTHDRYGDIA